MGWSKGKGLGAKEDGITEHIRVSYKHDSKGSFLTYLFLICLKYFDFFCVRNGL